jgi:hypothetical protein
MQVHWSAGRPGERSGEAVTVPLRPVAAPFVAVAQAGARVRARLRLAPEDEAVLRAVGGHLGSLAGRDLAARCTDGRMDARAKAAYRATRKKALTAESSSRWAGAITRTSEDQHQLAEQNLRAERASLRARIGRIQARLAVPAAGRSGRVRGYATPAERHAKAIRLRGLQARLTRAERRLEAGAVSVVRGGKALLRTRNNLAATGLTEAAWRLEWEAARLFLTADGEKDKAWGNETIRWHPGQGWLEIKLPTPLAHLANRPHGRYRLTCPVGFTYRGDEVAGQAASGAVIVADPAYTSRWGAQHWLAPLKEHHPEATGHHAAAAVIGRRGLGHRARRRANGTRTAPEDAARPARARTRITPARGPAPRKPTAPRDSRQPSGAKTGRPHRTTAGNQAAHDRSGPPARQDICPAMSVGTVDYPNMRARAWPA